MSYATAEERLSAQPTHHYVVRIAGADAPTSWDGWLAQAPGGGHILQSYAFGEFKRTVGWKPVRLVLERDGTVVGVGQFLVYRTPLVPGTLMYCTKGPWLPWDDEEAVQAFFDGVRRAAERERAHTVKIEPEVHEQQADVKAQLRSLGFRKGRYDLQFKTTMLIDLTPPEEVLLRRMKEKTRYNIRLAGRKGVTVAENNVSEAQAEFYRLFQITAARDGFVLRPFSYYRAIWQAMYDAGRAHLFFAEREGQRLAGMLIYTFGTKYWYMLGASSNEGRNAMPTYLLQWEVIQWAKTHGLTYYDMVAVPNPDHLDERDPMYGLYRFKVGFGGEVAEFLGCLDLWVNPGRAKVWYSFEPLYYRAYLRLKHNNYY